MLNLFRLRGSLALASPDFQLLIKAMFPDGTNPWSTEDTVAVLPELSLDGKLVERIARAVGKRKRSLELFVSGVLDEVGPGHFQNSAFTACFLRGQMTHYWRQVKHHRWKLDETQITRYNLG
jgi:hypothetical protein